AGVAAAKSGASPVLSRNCQAPAWGRARPPALRRTNVALGGRAVRAEPPPSHTSLRYRGGFMFSSRLVILAGSLALALFLPVLAAAAPSASPFPVTVKTAAGTVTLAHRPSRIISLSSTG